MSPAKIFLVIAVILLQCFAFAAANPRAVGMEFNKVKYRNSIDRRDYSVFLTLENQKYLYTVELDIGTPPQHFILQIDTGSSDLFVPSIDEDYCQVDPKSCSFTGTYVANQSSTSESLETPFITSFGDKSEYNGTFYKDTVNIGGDTLENVQFGVTTKTAHLVQDDRGFTAIGLIGVGFESNEATKYSEDYTYPNIISDLYNNELIGAKAFSLYLNGKDAPTGSILFGGVDTSLYIGPLISTPMIAKPGDSDVTEFAVEWTSFTAASSSGITDLFTSDSDEVPIYTLLDSGSTSSYFPSSLLTYVYSYLGANTEGDYLTVPCSISTADASLTFGFGGPDGPKITVPLSNFITPHSETPDLFYADNTPACVLTLRDNGASGSILGDNFLHSAYVVYDLDSKTIAIAEANLDPSDPSNIVEIGPGASGIPEVPTSGSETPSQTATASPSQITTFPASPSEPIETAPLTTPVVQSGSRLTIYPSAGSVTAVGTVATGTGTGTVSGGGLVNYTGTAISPSISPFSAAVVVCSKVDMSMVVFGVGTAVLMMAM